ncbi:AAA family ATPase [Bacillus cereus]|uniref:AAA family ATPase n=1 Tax=Bacillus cereus TaxID=1396 RepID=UPI000B4B9D42|nr:AAA family ATPase [Bacillus cereus]
MNVIKNVLAKVLDLGAKENFSTYQDDDFYTVVTLHKSTVLYARDKHQAEELIRLLESKYPNWDNIKSLQHLRDVDPSFYETIRPILRTYAVPKKLNGNYMSTLTADGTVKYKLSNGKLVTGTHINEGIAIRFDNTICHLDNIAVGRVITSMDSELQLKELYNSTKQNIPWASEKIFEVIDQEAALKNYLLKSKDAVRTGSPLPSLDPLVASKVQFKINGNVSESKLVAFENGMKKLLNMTGLQGVKKEVQGFIKGIYATEKLKKMNLNVDNEALHSLFVGPPGTGKTEVARIMGDLLWSMNMIKENKVVELSKEDLVSNVIGGTEETTKKKVEEALGGILFVDEAYMLKGSGENDQDFGKIALEIIMRYMENHKDNLVVIFAGYEKDIKELLDLNPGLPSRFAFTFKFNDFVPSELAEIADGMLSSKGFVTTKIQNELIELMKSKAKQGSLSGNARDVRVLVEEIVRKHKIRVADHDINAAVINPEDVQSLLHKKQEKNEEALLKLRIEAEKELHSLVGMQQLKDQVKTWANYVTIENRRFDMGINTEPPKLHSSFAGNPGTGKTTVARIVGKILKGNGILSSGHFVEVRRKHLVGSYMGHTAQKVNEVVQQALGGVLFIDEAYGLVKGENDTFGLEAVDELITALENHNDLVVIFAGYPEKLEELYATNAGFRSRIAETFLFEDYTSEELYQLFKIRIKAEGFEITESASDKANSLIRQAKDGGLVKDGNGRWVRKFIGKIKMAQANRLMNEGSNLLTKLELSDVEIGFSKL